jgi:hypothetical protein
VTAPPRGGGEPVERVAGVLGQAELADERERLGEALLRLGRAAHAEQRRAEVEQRHRGAIAQARLGLELDRLGGQRGGLLEAALAQRDVGQVAERDVEQRHVAVGAAQVDDLLIPRRRRRVVAPLVRDEPEPEQLHAASVSRSATRKKEGPAGAGPS